MSASLLAGCQGTNQNAATVNTNSPDKQTPTGSTGVSHRQIQTNGISMHIAEAGAGPPVVLLHGFPELWYSWRHQLPALASAGFHAVAPDMRGYGQTDAPPEIASYSMRNLTADVIGLFDALKIEKSILVGHDWGANVAWACAELYPERVASLVALSVPYRPRSPLSPTEMNEKFAQGIFSFVRYFQQPGVAEGELEKEVRDSLLRFYYSLSGDAPPDLVPYLFTKKSADAGVLDGMPKPEKLPSWLSESDLDYYTREFGRTGFRGPLNWYRNLDRNWRELPELGTGKITQPALFIGGERDSAVIFANLDAMKTHVPNLRKVLLLPGCGHWTQQERPVEVNRELLDFSRGDQGRE